MMRSQRGSAGTGRGFTIIEMLMVIVLIGIVATWAVPKVSMSRYRADAAGRLVRTLIQNAQRNAITRQSDVITSFDLAGNRLRLVQDYDNNDTINVGDKVDYRALEEGAHFATPTWAGPNGTTPAAPLVGNSLRTVSGLPGFVFRRDGSASSDAEIYVTVRNAMKQEYRAVLVNGATGRSELWKYNGTIWIRMTQ
ncbi:MAG TPA: type II secretion system protein [Gemmatimonadaceae bacterium]|nr:type II secretion system protein [Gemmatimonadaceae bacterium]